MENIVNLNTPINKPSKIKFLFLLILKIIVLGIFLLNIFLIFNYILSLLNGRDVGFTFVALFVCFFTSLGILVSYFYNTKWVTKLIIWTATSYLIVVFVYLLNQFFFKETDGLNKTVYLAQLVDVSVNISMMWLSFYLGKKRNLIWKKSN